MSEHKLSNKTKKETPVSGIVTSDSIAAQRKGHLKRFLIAAALIVGLLIVFVVAWKTVVMDDKSEGTVTPVASASEKAKTEYESLKQQPADPSATNADKASYYQQLATAAEGSGEYKAAVDAFKQREKLLGDSMDYYDFFTLAYYWCGLDKQAKSNHAIDQGVAQAQSDSALSGERKQEIQSMAEKTKKEGCAQWQATVDYQ